MADVAFDELRRSTHGVLSLVEGLDEERAREPSLLPGWTRAHVVAHLANNASSHVRMLEGVERLELLEQYPGGPSARATAIEVDSRRSAPGLVEGLHEACRRLDAVWSRLPEEAWARPLHPRWKGGSPRRARHLLWSRWREVEVHGVDLGLGRAPADWPERFVAAELEEVIAALPGRLPPGEGVVLRCAGAVVARAGARQRAAVVEGRPSDLLAWLLGRAEAPGVAPRVEGVLPELRAWR